LQRSILESLHLLIVLRDELQSMLKQSIKKLLGIEDNTLLNERITKISQYQNSVIAEKKNRLYLWIQCNKEEEIGFKDINSRRIF